MLEVKNISKELKNFSLRDISFSVGKGEYFILLGVSGAGKSMLLEVIAGLERPDSGQIRLDRQVITHEKIQHRGTGLVFQDFAIFPHMTVGENIAYPLHGSHLTQDQKKELVQTVSGKMNIGTLLDRKPSTLSGGELQRVALARTLVQDPKVLLLDEPLSALDSKLRSEIRSLLRQINRDGQTVVHVTHDYEEAISLADHIAVMNNGEIIQAGAPEEVFARPKSEFVAHFIGIKNFFPAEMILTGERPVAKITDTLRIQLGNDMEGRYGYLMIRNEDVIISRAPLDSSAANSFAGKVTEIVPCRAGSEVQVDIGVPVYATITDASLHHMHLGEEDEVWVNFKATAVRFIKRENR
jgi:molybdopterin-binding protein